MKFIDRYKKKNYYCITTHKTTIHALQNAFKYTSIYRTVVALVETEGGSSTVRSSRRSGSSSGSSKQ